MLNHDLEILLQRIAGGDESAHAVLYDRTNKLIFSLLMRMLGDAAVAEEALLDAYVELWKRAALYKPENGSAFSWMIATARSCAMEKRAAKGTFQQLEPLPESLCLEIAQTADFEVLFISERHQLVSSIINKLTPEQRQVLALAYFSCLKQQEIAERLGLQIETVKLHLYTGMNELREQLRRYPKE